MTKIWRIRNASDRRRSLITGDQFTMYAGPADGTLTPSAPITVVLHDPVYVGIGMYAHNADGMEAAVFSNVKIEQAAGE